MPYFVFRSRFSSFVGKSNRSGKFQSEKNVPQETVHHIWNHITISYRCRLCVLIVLLHDIDGRDSLQLQELHFEKKINFQIWTYVYT